MRLLLVAFLFAISYAQTVGGELEKSMQELSGFSGAVDKINVNPSKGYQRLEEEMSTGNFFSHGPVPKEDMEKSVNSGFISEVKTEKNPSPSLGLSSLATETKSSLADHLVLSLGTPTKATKPILSVLSLGSPKTVVASPLDLKSAQKAQAIPSIDDLLVPSIKANAGKVSATESTSSYSQKDVLIGVLVLTNAIFLFGWLNACARSKDIRTYEASLLEEI